MPNELARARERAPSGTDVAQIEAFLSADTNVPPAGISTYLVLPEQIVTVPSQPARPRSTPWNFKPTNDFERVALRALARASGDSRSRAQLRWPPLRPYYSKRTRASYQRSIRGYCVKWGLRIMTDCVSVHQPQPTAAELEALFYETIRVRAVTYSPYENHFGGRKLGISVEAIESIAADASGTVLEQWSASYVALQRLRGAAGGRKSRRGPSITPQAVQDTEAAAGERLSHLEVATILGCSVETVKRRRRELRSPS